MECNVFNIRTASEGELRLWYSEADPERQEQLRRLRRADDRLRSLCADHLAREMLGQRLKLPRNALHFTLDPSGKPVLLGHCLHFNLSHSGDFAACAVHEEPVGIDLEALRPIRPELCKKVCASTELAYVFPQGNFNSQRFLQLWTAKEAVLKQRGSGIRPDMRFLCLASAEGLSYPGLRLTQHVTSQYILTVAYPE